MSDTTPSELAAPPDAGPGRGWVTASPFLRTATVAVVALVVASALVVAAQRVEQGILARLELAATSTPPDQPPLDLDDLDHLAATARAARSRWLAGYLPGVAALIAVGVGAASRDCRRAWLACLAASAPVVAAGLALTAAASSWVRLLPALYAVAAALLATVVAVVRERAADARVR